VQGVWVVLTKCLARLRAVPHFSSFWLHKGVNAYHVAARGPERKSRNPYPSLANSVVSCYHCLPSPDQSASRPNLHEVASYTVSFISTEAEPWWHLTPTSFKCHHCRGHHCTLFCMWEINLNTCTLIIVTSYLIRPWTYPGPCC